MVNCSEGYFLFGGWWLGHWGLCDGGMTFFQVFKRLNRYQSIRVS